MDLRDRFEVHKKQIVECLDPDFGLLDELLANKSLMRQEVARVRAVADSYGRSEKLMEYVSHSGFFDKFLDALKKTKQTHLVNFILSNGQRSPGFGDDWPLTEKELLILDTNQPSLVDLLETSDLIPRLYSQHIVNNRQRDAVSSRLTSHEKNEALLEILRRTSLGNYEKTIHCLHSSNQNHIAKILKEGGGIVRVHSELETERNLNEVEDEIVRKFSEMLSEHSLEDSFRILESTQLHLIAAKRGNSIILYFYCKTSAEFANLQELQVSGKLAIVVREMFNSFLPRSKVTNLRTALFDEDLFTKCVGATAELEESGDEQEDVGTSKAAMLINIHTKKSRRFNLVSTKTIAQLQNFAVAVGFNDAVTMTKDVVKINLCRAHYISSEKQIPTTMKIESVAAVYCNAMYVAGVGINADEIWKFSVTSGWLKCASLVQGRRRHSAAFVDEVLYICGGYVKSDNRVIDSVEAYNAVTDKCTSVGKLIHCVMRSSNCVPFKSSIYIFGGGDHDNQTFNHVQVYNTKENMCSVLSTPMPRPYNLMRAVLWETSVILLGYSTCFIFNFETETWQERRQFKTGVFHFGLVHENDRIFVIGGGECKTDKDGKKTWKCRDDVRYVPLQNIIDDKATEWKIHATLPKPSLVNAYANMRFPV